MVSEIEDFSRYFAGETYREIAATSNRSVEAVEKSVGATFTALMDETGDGGRTFRREYREQNSGFRTNNYPGLLHAIRYARPKRTSGFAESKRDDWLQSNRIGWSSADTSGMDTLGHHLHRIGDVPLLNAQQEVELSKQIEAGVVAEQALNTYDKWLSEKEEEELEWLVQDGREAKEHFYLANLRLVFSIARRYPLRGSLTREDLVQEGNVILMHAVEMFDYTKGYKFSTYASNWIKQAITRALANQDEMIRKPVYVTEDIRKLGGVETKLINDGLEPTPELLASRLKWDVEKVYDLLAWRKSPASLDAPLGQSGRRFGGDVSLLGLISEGELLTENDEQIEKIELIAQIKEYVDYLDPRSADIMLSRYGLRTGEKETLEDVATRYGVSRERIRQLESKALARVRSISAGAELDGISA
jgi:RNA polymerase primary sigma factor